MKTRPITPARIAWDTDGTPTAPDYGDVYHPRSGALPQARHVFLRGNGLPGRWAGRRDFVMLETGFGLGHNFLATWNAWREDPARCERLHYVAIEAHPLTPEDLRRAHAAAPLPALASQLVAQWPLATPNLHTRTFEHGRVRLTLAYADVREVLPELLAQVDAFLLDGFAPARNPAMWERRVLKAIGRLAAQGATAATWSVAREVRDGLTEAGFEVEKLPGQGGKREITVARFAPRHRPTPLPSRRHDGATTPGRIVVVGAGLAGCGTAWALAELGHGCLLIDRHPQPAAEASGNPGGLYHGIVTPHDGVHARVLRAAALSLQALLDGPEGWRARHDLPGGGPDGTTRGLLRLEPRAADAQALHATIAAQQLPGAYVRTLGAAEAAALAGWPLDHPAWYYPGGGWTQPGALARAMLTEAGAAVTWRGGLRVARLARVGGAWQLFDDGQQLIAEADTVVLAGAADALDLLDPAMLGGPLPGGLPLLRTRGQISGLPLERFRAATGRDGPQCAVAGLGYALPPIDGRLWCGATTQPDDDDASVRDVDHRHNLAQLAALSTLPLGADDPGLIAACEGRTGWRLGADDRLPLIGALPDPKAWATPAPRRDQPRFVPRLPGLWLHTALGSRGLTTATLGARALAAWIVGTPSPVEASLLDALDAARFASRSVRRADREAAAAAADDQ